MDIKIVDPLLIREPAEPNILDTVDARWGFGVQHPDHPSHDHLRSNR